jgi:hypothetical protein
MFFSFLLASSLISFNFCSYDFLLNTHKRRKGIFNEVSDFQPFKKFCIPRIGNSVSTSKGSVKPEMLSSVQLRHSLQQEQQKQQQQHRGTHTHTHTHKHVCHQTAFSKSGNPVFVQTQICRTQQVSVTSLVPSLGFDTSLDKGTVNIIT